jgi:hypothetical protein
MTRAGRIEHKHKAHCIILSGRFLGHSHHLNISWLFDEGCRFEAQWIASDRINRIDRMKKIECLTRTSRNQNLKKLDLF